MTPPLAQYPRKVQSTLKVTGLPQEDNRRVKKTRGGTCPLQGLLGLSSQLQK